VTGGHSDGGYQQCDVGVGCLARGRYTLPCIPMACTGHSGYGRVQRPLTATLHTTSVIRTAVDSAVVPARHTLPACGGGTGRGAMPAVLGETYLTLTGVSFAALGQRTHLLRTDMVGRSVPTLLWKNALLPTVGLPSYAHQALTMD